MTNNNVLELGNVYTLNELKLAFDTESIKIQTMMLKNKKYIVGGERVNQNGDTIVDADGQPIIFPDQVISEYITFKNSNSELIAIMFCNRMIDSEGNVGTNITDLDDKTRITVLKNSTFKVTSLDYQFKGNEVIIINLADIVIDNECEI